MILLANKFRKEIIRLLGDTGKTIRFIGEMEYYLECSQFSQSEGALSEEGQKARLQEVGNAADKLAGILGNLDEDTDVTLRFALEEIDNQLSERLPELKANLDCLRDVANLQAQCFKPSVGASRKTNRDMFVEQMIEAYFSAFRKLPPYGHSENFISVVAILCNIAGHSDKNLNKVIGKAKRIVRTKNQEN